MKSAAGSAGARHGVLHDDLERGRDRRRVQDLAAVEAEQTEALLMRWVAVCAVDAEQPADGRVRELEPQLQCPYELFALPGRQGEHGRGGPPTVGPWPAAGRRESVGALFGERDPAGRPARRSKRAPAACVYASATLLSAYTRLPPMQCPGGAATTASVCHTPPGASSSVWSGSTTIR